MKKAFITGVNGQDGSYLSELLLDKGYQVYGLLRRKSETGKSRIDHLESNPNFKLVYGDVTDSSNIHNIISNIHPDEVYNLAAQSFVGISWKQPLYTVNVDGMGVLNILDAIKNIDPKGIKFYQASTSEMFGNVKEVPQTEETPFNPNSPYGAAKTFGFWITKVYRESYNMFACNGILFNHESPRRGLEFVTRKITYNVARINFEIKHNKKIHPLSLGNIYAKRDWGYAGDYVNAMYLILQHSIPLDFVISSGEMHTVKEFINIAFNQAGYDLDWINTLHDNEGNEIASLDEYAVIKGTKIKVLEINKEFFRPNDVQELMGDSTKAKTLLHWQPETSFKQLVQKMVDCDISKYKE